MFRVGRIFDRRRIGTKVAHSQPGFGLSGASLLAGQSIPDRHLRCFRLSSIPTRILDVFLPQKARDPSTPQIVAFAMICSGRG